MVRDDVMQIFFTLSKILWARRFDDSLLIRPTHQRSQNETILCGKIVQSDIILRNLRYAATVLDDAEKSSYELAIHYAPRQLTFDLIVSS